MLPFKLSPHTVLLLIAAVLTTHTTSQAEVAGPTLKLPGIRAQCSYCEDSDQNYAFCAIKTDAKYCQCRADGESQVRVLAGDASSRDLVAFPLYIKQKISALQKKYKKQGKSKSSTKKALTKLAKKLTSLHKQALSFCVNEYPIVLPTRTPTPLPDFEQPTLDVVAKKGEYTLYTLNKYAHSFVFDISEEGRIAGAFMTEEPTPDMDRRNFATGLRITSYYSARLTPFVWSQAGVKRACDNCQGLLLTSLNDSGKLAAGNKKPSYQYNRAVVFNYSTEEVSELSGATGAFTEAASINESNMIVGQSFGASEADRTASVWSNGIQYLLNRDQIINTLDARLKPLLEAQIKKDMRDSQELNECGEQEIESTQLIGRPLRTYLPHIAATRVADSGDVLGYVMDSTFEWTYTGQCQAGTHREGMRYHTFIAAAQGSLHVIPGQAVKGGMMSPTLSWSFPTALNNLGQLIGFGAADFTATGMQPITLNFRALETEWSAIPLSNSFHFQPTAINDRGIIAGDYSVRLDSERESPFAPKAFALLDNTLTDLNEFMGINPSGDFKLETVTAVNNCGVMVGRAYDSAKKQNSLFILAKDGCRIPS